MKNIQEEVAGNSVGSGAIAGIGVESPSLPNQSEPGIDKKKKLLTFKSFFKRKGVEK